MIDQEMGELVGFDIVSRSCKCEICNIAYMLSVTHRLVRLYEVEG